MNIISRDAARGLGLKRFFTGKPCKHGHLSDRFVSNKGCAQCLNESYTKYHPPQKQRERGRRRWAENPEGMLEKSRRHASKNRDRRNADARRRYGENPEIWKVKRDRSKISNPDGAKRSQKKYHEKNAVKRRQSAKNWRIKNPEKAKERWRLWPKENPEKAKAKAHRRRARIEGAGGSFTKEDLQRIYKMQKGRCAYCRETLREKYQIDHITSIKNGGTNDAKNIQLLCHKKGGGCNQMKNSKDPIDYARSIGLLL